MDLLAAVQVADQLVQVFHRVYMQSIRKSGLCRVLRRDEQPFHPSPPGSQGHGQHPTDGTQLPGQGHLAYEAPVGQVAKDLTAPSEQSHQHGQVVDRALFAPVGGG